MAAVIGDTALGAVNEGHGPFEAHRGEHRAERLAGLSGIDRQRLASEILLAVFRGLGPFANALDLGGIARILEHLLLVRQHLLVFRAAEQLEMIEHVVCILRHRWYLSNICRTLSPTPLAGASPARGAPAHAELLGSHQRGLRRRSLPRRRGLLPDRR